MTYVRNAKYKYRMQLNGRTNTFCMMAHAEFIASEIGLHMTRASNTTL